MLADFSIDKVPLPILLFMFGCLLLLVGLKRKGRRGLKAKPMAVRDTDVVKAADVRTITQELHALFADLQDTSRRVAAQIDNRTVKLEALIQEADEKIKRLEGLQGQPPVRPPERTSTTARQLESIVTPLPADSKYRRIYELADRGHTAREIAQEISAPSGEVELILNLRSKSPAGSV